MSERRLAAPAARLAAVGLGLVIAVVSGLTPAYGAAIDEAPPNVLIILTDDQRADLMSVMPQTLRLFSEEGVTYSNGFANTPLCCPARASLFSGLFAHNHGITSNAGAEGLDHGGTIQRYLQDAGYRTGMVGKYFNQWDLRKGPPFFDRWAIGAKSEYNVDGTLVSVDQYDTDYVADRAESLIRDFEAQGSAPWFLHVAPVAPHLPVSVAPEYQDAPVDPWEPPPSVSRPPDPAITDGVRRMLMSVDDLVGQLFTTLAELGVAEDTLAFFVSDNGFMWNEHALWAKNKPYTESIRVPFFARWPGHLPEGLVEYTPVALVDIAPTILEAAGQDPGSPMDGTSLLAAWPRTDMLTEAWESTGTLAWSSLRTTDYQYIVWFDSEGLGVRKRAFYRLDDDPWQMRNLLADRDVMGGPDVEALDDRLRQAVACGGTLGCESSLTSTDVEVHDAVASEDAGQMAFDVTLSRPTSTDVEVPFTVLDGTATFPADHGGSSGTLMIPAGQTSGQIVVPVVQDSLDEFDETVTVKLSSAVNATVIQGAATGTVIDDDLPPTMAISDASAGEASPAITFPVTLSEPSGKTITARYSTGSGTAMPGQDYVEVSGTLQIPPGQTSGSLSVPLLDDTLDEADETVVMTLSEPSEATVADGEATGTILDDDEPLPPPVTPSISISDASAGEASSSMEFTVTLSSPSDQQVSVAYSTGGGTATAKQDYQRISGTLTFTPGQTSATLTVPLGNDTLDEPDETFQMTLSNERGATLADGEATGTILDDDP